jgi:cytochrome d ubiquinol oxidase subunit II
LLVLITAAVFFWGLRRGRERLPFLMVLTLFFLYFHGLGVSVYPYLVPRTVTIWDAAAPPQSQQFMLIGTVVIFPVIIGYTAWAYWVYRGKAGAHGYH